MRAILSSDRRAVMWCPLAALLIGVVACQDDDIIVTTRNLDRPGPIALVCAVRDESTQVPKALPLARCVEGEDGSAAEGLLFGLTASTSRGDLALFRGANADALIDLEPGPGFGFVAVGGLPHALVATEDSCRAVSANWGTCDLSVVDVPGVLDLACTTSSEFAGMADLCPSGSARQRAVVSRLIPQTTEGPLLARPRDILIVPGESAPSETSCSPDVEYRAFVTFPTCGLVAEMNLRTGLVSQGIVIRPDGFQITNSPRCPAECGRDDTAGDLGGPPAESDGGADAGTTDGGTTDAGTTDAGTTDAGTTDAGTTDAGTTDSGTTDSGTTDAATAPASGHALPFALALRADGRRLFVSSRGASFISAIDLTEDGRFGAARQIPLDGDLAQTSAIAVSPPHELLGEFVYAVAADRSVRVVSVGLEQECETNLDLTRLAEGSDQSSWPASEAGCFPLAKDPPRKVTADGPGISFGPLVPRDVVFVDHASEQEAGPRVLDGIFAFIALSEGSIAVVDIADDDLLEAEGGTIPLDRLPHRQRPDTVLTTEIEYGVLSLSGQRSGGVPVVVSTFAGRELTDEQNRQVDGVALRGIGEQNTTQRLIYEQQLLERFTGQLVLGADSSGTTGEHALQLADRGGDFCARGVLAHAEEAGRALRHGDIVTVVGCEEDIDCGLDQVCRKPQVQQSETGLCLARDRQDELFTQCRPWLRQDREFLVRRADPTSLVLDALPSDPQRLIRQDPPQQCTTNKDCAEYFYCVVDLGQIEGQKRWARGPEGAETGTSGPDVEVGQCARPGCQSDADCSNDGTCIAPLDGSPRICAPVPPPLDPWPLNGARVCTKPEDCEPEKRVESVCDDDTDCPDAATECRSQGRTDGLKRCRDRGWQCVRFAGMPESRCLRPSPCFEQLQHYTVNVGRSFMVSGGFVVRSAVDAESGACTPVPGADPLLANRIPVGPAVYPFVGEPLCEDAPSLEGAHVPRRNACFQLTATGQSYNGFVSKQANATGKELADDEAGPAVIVRHANPQLVFSLGLSHLSRIAEVGSEGVERTEGPPMPERGLLIDVRAKSEYVPQFVLTEAGGDRRTSDVIALPGGMLADPIGHVYISDMGDRGGNLGSRGQVQRVDLDQVALDPNFLVR